LYHGPAAGLGHGSPDEHAFREAARRG